jgi:hypothetical protein
MAWLGTLGVLSTGCMGGSAHSQSPVTSATEEEARLRRRFRGIKGGQLRIDATFNLSAVDL